ncbi:MAG: MFS transporter [Actinomycetia bacterium]|nr:MFS transporter [Actinomycetes bacterium]
MTQRTYADSPTGPGPWTPRLVALLGIALVALNLRIGVAAVSPISDIIRLDIPLTPRTEGLLAAAPPLIFAATGLVADRLGRRYGLESMLVAAMAISATGELLRATCGTTVAFLAWTIPIMAGAGLGNILCPAVVKKHFPDRIGLVTAVYTGCVTLSTALPPLVVARLAEAAGWRPALGVWALLTAVAAIPWLWIVFHPDRRGLRWDAVRARLQPNRRPDQAVRLDVPLWRNPLAWSLMLVFAGNSLIAYTMFGWLPEILRTAGFGVDRASWYLALMSLASLPGSLLVPVLVARMKRLWLLPPIFLVGYVTGLLGLALAPAHATLGWIVLTRVGDCFFPYTITLITLRARTPGEASAVSGFVQSVGYLLAAAGPWLMGTLAVHAGGWRVPMLVLLIIPPIQFAGAMIAARTAPARARLSP